MKITFALKLITLSLLAPGLWLPALAQNTVFTYQGQVLDKGTNFNGPGQFKFALVTSAGSTFNNYWYNDGTSLAASEPAAAVDLRVSNGLFTVVLGNTTLANMTALPVSLFTSQPNLQLRIWFNDGVNGFAALSPVQNLTPAPYAVDLLGSLPTAQLSGPIANDNLPPNPSFPGAVTLAGSLILHAIGPSPVVIYAGSSLLLDADNNYNFFTGPGAGNLTLSGSANTGIGPFALESDTSGSGNTALGASALAYNTTGGNNTAIGEQALEYNTAGSANTAVGLQALLNNTTGGYNTAIGHNALGLNTTGSYNTANGQVALGLNTTGSNNTANGQGALFFNSTGNDNTANGQGALYFNTAGNVNTATGQAALQNNTTGAANTANGQAALRFNTTGSYNTATGEAALANNTTGSYNTATGPDALVLNTAGGYNTAIGYFALENATNNFNVAVGFEALQNATGQNNVALGSYAGVGLGAGNNNIEILAAGASSDNNVIRIGAQGTQTATYIAGISGATAASGVAVYVNASGQLGTLTSSARFKKDIHSMGAASDVLLSLHPVSFKYKPELDPQGLPQFGLVAEEVDKVDPDLVARDGQGKISTVRYEAVNAMLLNEFLKQHRTVEKQAAEIEQLRQKAAKFDALEKRLDELQLKVQSLPLQK